MKGFLDIYSIKARLFPVFLVLLPIPLAVMAWLPSTNFPVLSISGFGIAAGLSFFLAEIARDAGKAKEPNLFHAWGGPPTTQLLRHKNKAVNPNLRERWHQRIEALTGSKLPSAASEAKSPEKADALYEAAVYEVRERRRSAEAGSLFFKENVSYGFRRNLWGMKPAGLTLAALGLTASISRILWVGIHVEDGQLPLPMSVWGATFGCAVILVLWTMRVTPTWVKKTAFAYGERLLGTLFSEPTAT